jgi:hypothetical protein
MFKTFHKMFGKDFLSHVAFIITNWSYSKGGIRDRERGG